MNIQEEIEKLKEQIAKLEMMAKASAESEDESEEMEMEDSDEMLNLPKLKPMKDLGPEPSATDDEANMKKSMIMSMMKKKGY